MTILPMAKRVEAILAVRESELIFCKANKAIFALQNNEFQACMRCERLTIRSRLPGRKCEKKKITKLNTELTNRFESDHSTSKEETSFRHPSTDTVLSAQTFSRRSRYVYGAQKNRAPVITSSRPDSAFRGRTFSREERRSVRASFKP